MPNENTDSLSWFTNFYYEEELRSMLFNGALNSGFKPGIYNPKMALYTVSEETESSDASTVYAGVHLYIGKGTTFVFSNRYSYDDERYHLDLKTPGSYIIKSTAANDLDIPIVRLGQHKTTGAETIMGDFASGTLADSRFYIAATLTYDEEENLQTNHPTITVLRNNPNFVTTLNREDDSLNFYYNYLNMSPTATSYYVPDGSHSYTTPTIEAGDSLVTSSTLLKRFCWLPIGVVINTGEIDQYLNNADWNDSQLRVNAAEEWTKNHVFIGRGFPSYRQNYISNKFEFSPDVVPNTDLNALYLDINDIYDGDILYNSELSANDDQGFEGPLGIGLKAAHLNTEPSRLEAYRMDYLCENPKDLVGEEGNPDDFESINYTEASDIIKDINENWIKGNIEHPFMTTDYLLISDIIFLTTRRRYSNTNNDSLINIFSKDNTLNSKLKVVPFRWYSTLETVTGTSTDESNALFNPSQRNDELTEDDTNYGNTLSLDGYSLTQTRLLPLDICENNITRLYKIIQNKNIIPNVIDYLRQNPGVSPYLNPIEATSLVPAAIIFRKVKVTTGALGTEYTGTSLEGQQGIVELEPVDTVSRITSEEPGQEGSYLPGRFHPANVLSFFDMEYKTNRLNPINFKSSDIYSVLPVIS